MTTRAPGLTAAVRRVGEVCIRDGSIVLGGLDETVPCPQYDVVRAMHSRLLLKFHAGSNDHFASSEWLPTPRLIAALAAPRMTAAELEWMERIGVETLIPTGILPKVVQGLFDKGWIQQYAGMWLQFTRSGLTALNNMRAAMGSAEYREDLK